MRLEPGELQKAVTQWVEDAIANGVSRFDIVRQVLSGLTLPLLNDDSNPFAPDDVAQSLIHHGAALFGILHSVGYAEQRVLAESRHALDVMEQAREDGTTPMDFLYPPASRSNESGPVQ